MSNNNWRLVFDSVAGTSHIANNLPCQDSCRVIQLETETGNILVACLSDGAGSAKHSEIGSQIACDTLITIIRQHVSQFDIHAEIKRELALEWCREIRDAIQMKADESEVAIRELACTLLVAIITESSACFIQIGDGAIVQEVDGGYEPVFWPQSGEYANTTNFLTDSTFETSLEFRFQSMRTETIAVFSDGLERLVLRFADKTVHEPFLNPLFNSLQGCANTDDLFPQLQAFLTSEQINKRTDDDKTLILATRRT